MKKSILYSCMLLLLISASSCNRKSTTAMTEEKTGYTPAIATEAGPPVIVYKTREHYAMNVPVILSGDKKEIISYPDRKDIFYKGELAYPVDLQNGYLLDRRGINEHVAFTHFTYEEYARLEKTPSPEELFKAIIDNDPLTEMWHCGGVYQYKDLENEIANVIEAGNFKGCTRLK